MVHVLDNLTGRAAKTTGGALAERLAPVAAISAVVFLMAVVVLL